MSQTFECNTGIRLEYDTYGDPGGVPVLLLHGLSSNRSVYDHLTRDLELQIAARDLYLINPDLRGHGRSSHAGDAAGYRASDYAADVAGLLRATSDKPAVIIAESLGGVIAVALAQAEPDLVRAMLLEDPPLFLGSPERLTANAISQEFPEFIELVDEMQSKAASASDYDEVLRDGSEPDELDEMTHYVSGLGTWDTNSMRAALSGDLWKGSDPLGTLPDNLVILRADPAKGAAFEAVDVDVMQHAHPSARIDLVEGATHSLRAARHDAFVSKLDEFVASLHA